LIAVVTMMITAQIYLEIAVKDAVQYVCLGI